MPGSRFLQAGFIQAMGSANQSFDASANSLMCFCINAITEPFKIQLGCAKCALLQNTERF
jgi:hypothetical protein